MTLTLTPAQKQMLEDIEECDGLEVHKADWRVAERLVAKGLTTLGGARGPERAWRRAELVTVAAFRL